MFSNAQAHTHTHTMLSTSTAIWRQNGNNQRRCSRGNGGGDGWQWGIVSCTPRTSGLIFPIYDLFKFSGGMWCYVCAWRDTLGIHQTRTHAHSSHPTYHTCWRISTQVRMIDLFLGGLIKIKRLQKSTSDSDTGFQEIADNLCFHLNIVYDTKPYSIEFSARPYYFAI